jgi:hypothetical protein
VKIVGRDREKVKELQMDVIGYTLVEIIGGVEIKLGDRGGSFGPLF